MSSSKICPFCDSSQVFRYITETSQMRAIYPKNPAIAYHVLITPKRHVKHLDDLTTSESLQAFVLLKQLTKKAKLNLKSAYLGFNVLSNNGDPSINQQVPHAHIHAFLRTKQDKIDPIKSRHSKQPMEFTQEQLKDLEAIKSWF